VRTSFGKVHTCLYRGQYGSSLCGLAFGSGHPFGWGVVILWDVFNALPRSAQCERCRRIADRLGVVSSASSEQITAVEVMLHGIARVFA
jgi:hypothetical protein